MNILIIDDDEQIVASLMEALQDNGVIFDAAYSGNDAVAKIESGEFDLVLLDLVLPELTGIEILEKVNAAGLKTEFIMITGFGKIETAIEAMKLGAIDYLTKPVNLQELRFLVKRTRERFELKEENRKLRNILKGQDDFREMIGTNPEMMRIKDIIRQVSDKKVTVLIDGESGTGKEIVANAIYEHSSRKGFPFLKVNCGALSQGILESELFGHEKGSFTGAASLKKGIFESANKGTIFLDEIGEMPIESQVRLLRVLESGEFSRVGGVDTIKTDVRIVAATNKDLEEEVEAGDFREDLFYRLKVINIHLPPLRERPDDIPFLVKHFLDRYNLENNTSFKGLSHEVLDFLSVQKWKGNIRELRNVVDKILVFSSNDLVEYSDLPDDLLKIRVMEPVMEFKGTMAQIERSVIENTMALAGGNVRRVSNILDIPLRTLYRKLKNLGIKG